MTILALALGSVLMAAPTPVQGEQFSALTVDDVAALVAKHDADVFDDNDKDRYVQSHVPTATWLQFNQVKESDLPKDHSRKLVFYCANEH